MVFSGGGASIPALKSDDWHSHHPDRGTVVTRPGHALDGRRKQLSGSQRTGESLSSYYWGSSTDLDSPLTTHASTRVSLPLEFLLLGKHSPLTTHASTRVSLLLEFSLLEILHRSWHSSYYSSLYTGRLNMRVLLPSILQRSGQPSSTRLGLVGTIKHINLTFISKSRLPSMGERIQSYLYYMIDMYIRVERF